MMPRKPSVAPPPDDDWFFRILGGLFHLAYASLR